MTNSAEDDWPRRVAILGVGLLGGSVSLAIRRLRPETTFVGYSRNAGKLARLIGSGVVDVVADSIDEACQDCDVVVVATPVDLIASLVTEAAAASPAECLITDVGSTKGRIVNEVADDRLAAKKFLAAHPIAGSEKSGAEHASATLFDDRVVVLTPIETTDADLLSKAGRFWRMTGGVTHQMHPAQHDAYLAAVSHVPHLVSALVARMATSEARSLVGTGWQDITRVAAGDPGMWTAICQQNRTAIAAELERLSGELDGLRQIIIHQDDVRLKQWLAEAKQAKQQTP